jgi:hypothetical protein
VLIYVEPKTEPKMAKQKRLTDNDHFFLSDLVYVINNVSGNPPFVHPTRNEYNLEDGQVLAMKIFIVKKKTKNKISDSGIVRYFSDIGRISVQKNLEKHKKFRKTDKLYSEKFDIFLREVDRKIRKEKIRLS